MSDEQQPDTAPPHEMVVELTRGEIALLVLDLKRNNVRPSREISLAITKLQEAAMWLAAEQGHYLK